jgi:hypothetical protein
MKAIDIISEDERMKSKAVLDGVDKVDLGITDTINGKSPDYVAKL